MMDRELDMWLFEVECRSNPDILYKKCYQMNNLICIIVIFVMISN